MMETGKGDGFFKEVEEKSDISCSPRHVHREVSDVILRDMVTVSTIKNASQRFEECSKRALKEPDLHVKKPIDYTIDKHTRKLCKDEIFNHTF